MKEVTYSCPNCSVDCQHIASEFDSTEGTKLTEYRCKECSTRYQITLKGTMMIKRMVMKDGKILDLQTWQN
jgi:hypothetical protein